MPHGLRAGEYDAKASDPGRKVEIHGFQRLEDGATMVVETSSDGYDCRLLEIKADGMVRLEFPLVTNARNTHSDTRNATKTNTGTYLVAHENDGSVREYSADGSGEVIWEFAVPLFGKERENGIDGHGPTAFGTPSEQVFSGCHDAAMILIASINLCRKQVLLGYTARQRQHLDWRWQRSLRLGGDS